MNSCPFCSVDQGAILAESGGFVCIWDSFPVSKGHTLVLSKRHVQSWFDATVEEQSALLSGVSEAQRLINERYSPDGFNVGINVAEAAGQTIPHLHIHVIPRYEGDVVDPRGGVRHVIPGKGNYLVGHQQSQSNQVFGLLEPAIDGLAVDAASAIAMDVAVAFVTRSGLAQIEPYLIDLLERGGKVRLLTGDYLDVTEPRALSVLNDLGQEYPGQFAASVFETDSSIGFHPKIYILYQPNGRAVIYVGSSNLTKHGLTSGIEWNQRFEGARDDSNVAGVEAEFAALLEHKNVRPLTAEWIQEYGMRRRFDPSGELGQAVDFDQEAADAPPTPNMVQQEALAELHQTRREGNQAGLVVMATGLGKTWLSAFDSVGFKRVLFVAHREEILNQALRTFRRIRPESRFGVYVGGQYDQDAEVLFASVQTLSRKAHLTRFPKDAFDYIVVDEFHHASAATYRRLIDYFVPEFLLGLTATPERTDGGDLLALCGENLVFRADLVDGINRGLLAPFQYFGVPDLVDFANIPWRSGRFDPESLEHAVATEARASNALDQWREKGQSRTLAFCVSRRHADFMAEYFVANDIRAVAVHSGPTAYPRTQALEMLASGDLDVVFAVDMFNEGVDVPTIDTVMMLRPTESKILWLQQLGRGLRKAADKTHLAVIDYIGNHRSFLQVPALLIPGIGDTPGEIRRALIRLERGELELPQSCSVQYELEAISILKQLAERSKDASQVVHWYRSYKELHGRRPTATEAYHEGYGPQAVRTTFGSWFSMVASEGDLDDRVKSAFDEDRQFFESLEKTPMSKSFKMLVLQAMMTNDSLPGRIRIEELMSRIRGLAGRLRVLSDEFGGALADDAQLRRHLERNPIDAWCDGKGMNDVSYFEYVDGELRSQNIRADNRNEFLEITRELVDFRMAQYLDRLGHAPEPKEGEPDSDKAQLWHEYMRGEIPALFGLEFVQSKWRQGLVREGEHMFLLVSLDKVGMAAEHQYADRFLSSDEFQWASQNRTKRSSGVGKSIKDHETEGTSVHLFIRDRRKTPQGKAAPFVYCGDVTFVDWEGDQPISIRWRLDSPVSGPFLGRFRVPDD